MEMRVLFCCLGTTDWKKTKLDSCRRHLDSRIVATCDGRPDHILTWIQALKYFLESYFHMHQTSCSYHVGAGRNHHFSAETFSANGVVTPYFGPLGRVSC
jgi:hypothetical protein